MPTSPEAAEALVAHRFKPGHSGNPSGKPTGSRNRLQGDFVRRLADDFDRFGIYAIARARRQDPIAYVRVVASLMPKQIERTDPFDELSDEQLDAAIAAVRAILAAKSLGGEEATQGGRQAVVDLPALPETG